jgi:DNA polymerase I
MRAIGVDLRDIAKTFFYAFIYGAGDGKLGSIVGKGRKEGKILRKKFLANVKGLKELTEQVKKEFNDKGYLVGLDGRKLQVRSEHSALNTKLQSAGAVIMKKALVILDKELQKTLVPGIDYEFVANVHD